MPSRRPENFSWLEEGVLAGSAIPWEPGHFQYYLDHNIKTLVTLTEFKPPMQYAPEGLKHVFMPVVEFEPPSIKQVIEFTQIVEKAKEKGEGVCVHCHWGRGRTGVMLAAYLVASQSVFPRKAITRIRTLRPYSIETPEQEDVIWELADALLRQNIEAESD